MESKLRGIRSAGAESHSGRSARLRLARWFRKRRVSFMIAAVALLGTAALALLVTYFEPAPLQSLPWLLLVAGTALVVAFPYRVDHLSRSYFLDFDETLLIISLLYLSPQGLASAMLIGYLAGAILRKTPGYRLLFNTGLRATGLTVGLMVASFVPLTAPAPWEFVVQALIVSALYSLINQAGVSWAMTVMSGGAFPREFRRALRGELARTWPMVVGYGLVAGIASMVTPLALFVGMVPVVVQVYASRESQQRRDEHLRMAALYEAAQKLHEVASEHEVIQVLEDCVKETLRSSGCELREEPPVGDELGTWLANLNLWAVVAAPVSPETRGPDESFLRALGSLVDSGIERATKVGELERQSLRDPLTNAYNRRHYLKVLNGTLSATIDRPGCLALIDVDRFKEINDSYGHEVGDEALLVLVEAIERIFRSGDVLCRLGGDEFALILPGMGPQQALGRFERLRRFLRSHPPAQLATLADKFTVSVGIASYPDDARDVSSLMRAADQALYCAKRGGRNRIALRGEDCEEAE